MAYRQILIDTCSYLRIAKTIHPLLGVPFGKPQYALYIIPQIKIELDRKDAFRSQFDWLKETNYILERKKVVSFNKVVAGQIDDAYDFIWDFQKDGNYGLSSEDVYCIATSNVMGLPLVTDDRNIRRVAREFNIKKLDTLELLKLMLVNKFISISVIDDIMITLQRENDLPYSFRKTYTELFRKPFPEAEQ